LSVPITQHVTQAEKLKLEGKAKIAIKCSKVSDQILAIINEPVFFENRKEEISTRVFGTFGKTKRRHIQKSRELWLKVTSSCQVRA